MVEEGLRCAAETGEQYYESELYRLRGDIKRLAGDPSAETDLRRALEIARAQRARSLELRAAVGLGRLLVTLDRADEATTSIASIYSQFREGLDTRDLVDARELLGRL